MCTSKLNGEDVPVNHSVRDADSPKVINITKGYVPIIARI